MRLVWLSGLLTLVLATPARAITNGTLDEGRHPFVGALIAEGFLQPGRKDLACSGTLISPTVFLTVSHCTTELEALGVSKVWVTFEDQFTPTSKLYEGRMVSHPLYGHDEHDSHDIAVVILKQAVRGITPARLPTAGLLDQMKAAGTLSSQRFTNVGYGTEARVTGPGGPTFPFSAERAWSVSSFNALGDTYMRLSQNAATGDSGTCYGDSGGPHFLGAGASETNIVTSIDVAGDSQCVALAVVYRLDTASARAFLAPFVTLP